MLRRRFASAATLLCAALAVTGCGGGSTEDKEEAGGSSVLRMATDSDLAGIWDPHRTASPFATPLMAQVYEPLVRYGDAGLEPGIATEWSFSADGATFDLTLREGVTFHDGEPLDADAVVANIERAQTVEGSSLVETLADIETVEAVSPTQVQFTLARTNTALPGLLADRPGMMISPAAFENADLDVIGVGAGPYTLETNEPGANLVFEQFGDYYDSEMSRVNGIEINIMDPEAARNAFLDGQLDVVDIAPTEVGDFEDQGFPVEIFAGAETQIMYLNKSGPLADERVRQAISLAIDRQGLSEALTNGQCVPTGQAYGPGTSPHDDALTAPDQDLAQAKSLMTEAGVSELEIDMVTFPADTTAEALVPMLAEIGVTLKVQKVMPPELTHLFVNGEVDAYYTRLSGATEPAVTLDILLDRFNPAQLKDDELNSQADTASQATDPAARTAAFRSINQRMSEVVWNVPICNVAVPFAYQDDGVYFGLNSLNLFDWYDIRKDA